MRYKYKTHIKHVYYSRHGKLNRDSYTFYRLFDHLDTGGGQVVYVRHEDAQSWSRRSGGGVSSRVGL